LANLKEQTVTELENRKASLITKMESRRKELTMTVNTLAVMIAEVDKELKSREVVTNTNA
jgi:hypothetical protein